MCWNFAGMGFHTPQNNVGLCLAPLLHLPHQSQLTVILGCFQLAAAVAAGCNLAYSPRRAHNHYCFDHPVNKNEIFKYGIF